MRPPTRTLVPLPRSVLAAGVVALAACGGDAAAPAGDPGTDRETFIATYVDLRTEVIRGSTHELGEEQRRAVLARHGVTEEDLMSFAEFHGRDVAFMREVWDEVEARLDGERLLPSGQERR